MKTIPSKFSHSDNCRRIALCLGVLMIASASAFAAGDTGGAAIAGAANTIKGYKDSVKALMNAIGCIIALVGAFQVYYKMQNGDQDVKKTIMLTLGGCIAFVALGQALPAFFE